MQKSRFLPCSSLISLQAEVRVPSRAREASRGGLHLWLVKTKDIVRLSIVGLLCRYNPEIETTDNDDNAINYMIMCHHTRSDMDNLAV